MKGSKYWKTNIFKKIEAKSRSGIMGNMEFRYAVEKDIPLILQFIRELAEYEKMADEGRFVCLTGISRKGLRQRYS